MNKIALQLKNISFGYEKDKKILDDLSLEVSEGSFTAILGESGSGKTTLLRLISGFLALQEGEIFIDGSDQRPVEPDRRKVGIVFQDYALFPHMTVMDNISYGLKIKRKEKPLTRRQVQDEVLELCDTLSLSGLLKRYPHELSGGQQQRVALARSLILKPQILLMDEPLSNLDAKLRESVRDELAEIQKKLRITTVYVTHDQAEALSLSDSIAVLRNGKLLQCSSPREIYFKPADEYTADFVGRANFISIDGEKFLVRPEWFSLNKSQKKGELEGVIESTLFLGDRTRFIISSATQKIIADLPTLETNAFTAGCAMSLNISHRWKM